MNLIDILKQTEAGEMLITFFVAMLPILELRGAIPLGVGMGLNHMTAMLVSMIGNFVPVPFIILFIRRIFKWLRRRFDRVATVLDKIERRARGKWEKVHMYQFWGLMILVAIPLPGTGAWTGALIAALMNMRLRNAMCAIFLGVVVAGFLITGLTFGFTSILN